jgi:hypothetical protein
MRPLPRERKTSFSNGSVSSGGGHSKLVLESVLERATRSPWGSWRSGWFNVHYCGVRARRCKQETVRDVEQEYGGPRHNGRCCSLHVRRESQNTSSQTLVHGIRASKDEAGTGRCRHLYRRTRQVPKVPSRISSGLEVPSLRTTVHTTSPAANSKPWRATLPFSACLGMVRGRRRKEQLSGSFQRKLDRQLGRTVPFHRQMM